MYGVALNVCLLLTSQVTVERQPRTLEQAQSGRRIEAAPAQPTLAEPENRSGRELKSVMRTSAATDETVVASAESPLAPVESSLERGIGPDLLKQALKAPQEGALTGRPTTLLQAISRSGDRTQQLWITRAYWKLTIATAEFHFALDEFQRLEQVATNSQSADTTMLQCAAAAANARVREAEIAAISAQHELTEIIQLPASEPLPLTLDVPHVGQYRTHFETLFAARTPPVRARLIDRTLPIRRELIEARASAVRAAEESKQEAETAYARSATDIRTVLASHEAIRRERRGFLDAVRDYNYDVAEYAMTVAQVGTSEAVLVSMLIKTSSQPGPAPGRFEPTPASRPAEVEPAEVKEPGKLEWVKKDATAQPEQPPQAIPSAPANSPFQQDVPSTSILKRPR